MAENAVLTDRVIDRPMRPLFPKDYRNDVTLENLVLSVDQDCSPELTAFHLKFLIHSILLFLLADKEHPKLLKYIFATVPSPSLRKYPIWKKRRGYRLAGSAGRYPYSKDQRADRAF